MLGRGCLRALQANPAAARVSSKGVRAAFAAGSNGRAPTTQSCSQPSSTWSPITPLGIRSMTPTLQNAGCQVNNKNRSIEIMTDSPFNVIQSAGRAKCYSANWPNDSLMLKLNSGKKYL